MRLKISLGVILILIFLSIGMVNSCQLKEVVVEGCELSSADEIKEKMENYAPMENTLLLYLKSKMKPFSNAAFVAKTDVSFEGKNKVIVTVYEKMVAGCIYYMENYVYFDKDGNVLETSQDHKSGVPCISGLKIDNWQMGEKIPIKDEKKFKIILNLTQLIEKYSLSVDGIAFTPENEVILQCGTINVELGEGENLSVQMMNLNNILSGLEGKKGTLYMKDFDSDNSTASFKATGAGTQKPSGKQEESSGKTDEGTTGEEEQESSYEEDSYEESSYEEDSYEEDSYEETSYEEETDEEDSYEDGSYEEDSPEDSDDESGNETSDYEESGDE